MTKLREVEKRQLKESAIRAEIERLRVAHNARVAYLQSLLTKPAAAPVKKRVMKKKVPADANLKSIAKPKPLPTPEPGPVVNSAGVLVGREVQPAKVG